MQWIFLRQNNKIETKTKKFIFWLLLKFTYFHICSHCHWGVEETSLRFHWKIKHTHIQTQKKWFKSLFVTVDSSRSSCQSRIIYKIKPSKFLCLTM